MMLSVNKIHLYLLLALMLVVSCECKDMHVRRMPEEKDIVFEGEANTAKKSVYRKGQSRDIQVHLTSSDEEAKDAQFKILSATLADGSPADLDYTSLKLGDNTLSYTPKGPGTHALTIKVAVEGEEENAQTIHYTLEAPAANWQVRGTADHEGNLTLQIADVPEELQGEPWRITNTTWSRGLRGTMADTSTLNCGDNNLQVALTHIALEEPPTLNIAVENDGEEKLMSIDLRALCIARLEETLSEAQIQTLHEHNAAVKAQASTYQESYTGTAREDARRVMRRLFEETTRHQQTTITQLESLETNLNSLRHQDPAGLAVLDTRRTALQRVLEEHTHAVRMLQPMVTRLEESNTGSIDPYGVLYEALQGGSYEAESMASQLASPLLKVNEPDQQGKTLLHLAIEQENVPLSEILIENGAEVNVRDTAGKTPLEYATEANNQEAIALLLGEGAEQDLPPAWQLQGRYDTPSQQLTLTISDAPERSRAAQWRIANVEWSGGTGGNMPNVSLQYGENGIFLPVAVTTLTAPPSLRVLVQGPDNAYQAINIDLTATCIAQVQAKEMALTTQTDRVNAYVQETNDAYTLPQETVNDPRVNREKQAEIATLLERLTAFQTQYQEELQTFEHSLETLDQAEVSENLPVFKTNNTSLENAIANLKSAQVQLQQQCTSAHMALFKMIETITTWDENETVFLTLLGDPRFDVNGRDERGYSLLHVAAGQGHDNFVKTLLEKEAAVNAKNLGFSPLYIAAQNGQDNVVQTLLDNGARVNEQTDVGHAALHRAAYLGHNDVVKTLLERGAALNLEDKEGCTPLHEAAQGGRDDVVKTLLEKGAAVNATDNEKWTPLRTAQNSGHNSIVTLL